MPKNCFTICIDMDDTIEDLLPAWLKWLSGEYHLERTVDDVTGWDILGLFPFLTPEQIYAPLFSADFWKNVKPKEDAIYYIKKLIEDGHDVYVCTASHYSSVDHKMREVLEKHFPFIDYRHIIVAYNKQMIKCDIMIDDGIHNLVGGDYLKILYNAKHNAMCDCESEHIRRASSWEEIYNIVKDLDWIYSCKGFQTIDY